MSKSRRSMADKKFAMIKKKNKSLDGRAAEEQKIRETTAKLRALRLAKEEADRVAAEQAAAKKALTKSKAPRKKKASLVSG